MICCSIVFRVSACSLGSAPPAASFRPALDLGALAGGGFGFGQCIRVGFFFRVGDLFDPFRGALGFLLRLVGQRLGIFQRRGQFANSAFSAASALDLLRRRHRTLKRFAVDLARPGRSCFESRRRHLSRPVSISPVFRAATGFCRRFTGPVDRPSMALSASRSFSALETGPFCLCRRLPRSPPRLSRIRLPADAPGFQRGSAVPAEGACAYGHVFFDRQRLAEVSFHLFIGLFIFVLLSSRASPMALKAVRLPTERGRPGPPGRTQGVAHVREREDRARTAKDTA